MKRTLALILAIGLAGSVHGQGEKATEPLSIVGPYFQLVTQSTGAVYTISGPPGTYQISGQAIVPGLTPANVLITITIPALCSAATSTTTASTTTTTTTAASSAGRNRRQDVGGVSR